MSGYREGFPLTIVNVLDSEEKLAEMFDGMVEELERLVEENADDPEYIPPIVYSEQGKAYNVEYNFLVHSIAWVSGEEAIERDFKLAKNMSSVLMKYATFLSCGMFEDFYEVARINVTKVNVSKYKTAGSIDIIRRPFNPICIKNGENLVRFNAVHLNGMKLKKAMSEDAFSRLEAIAKQEKFEQVSFGENQFQQYKKDYKLGEIEYVF